MEDLTIHTSRGPIGIWGGPFDPAEPLVLFIGGAFVAERNVLAYKRVLSCDFALTHLPGVHTPYFAENSIEAFAEAADEALAQLGHARALVVGESLGGLVALAMRSVAIEGRLVLDTPLTTAGLWPIHYPLRERSRLDPQVRRWIEDLFGIYDDRVEDRDYRHLLQNISAESTWLLRADAPLGEPRDLNEMPSLVSADDFAAYKAAGMKDYYVRDSGHHLAVRKADATAYMIGRLCDLLWGRPLRQLA